MTDKKIGRIPTVKHPKPPPLPPPPETARTEPKWSTTPPEESGTYWVREVGTNLTATVFMDAIGEVWGLPEGGAAWEWYPVRIEEPPR